MKMNLLVEHIFIRMVLLLGGDYIENFSRVSLAEISVRVLKEILLK